MGSHILPNDKTEYIGECLEQMYPEAACALNHRNNFEMLVSVVLSAQTTDVSVNKVTPELFGKYPLPEDLANADYEDVCDIIRTIGLYKTKAKNIITLSGELVERFGGEVPGDFDSLVSLPGVGRKSANVVLAECFGVPRIAVDTHVFRVANRIGLTDESDVTNTEEALMRGLPRDRWIRFHHLLIFHGRKCCRARNPLCSECLLAGTCLYSIENNGLS